MYVEDEVDALCTMMEFLALRGFAVITAVTAGEGYEKLKKYNPDLILVDMTLIGESGIDFIKRIQKEGVKTPVIVLIDYPQRTAEIELRGLNVYGYFEKPLSLADLYKTIKTILEVV